jgi:uncharacterized protein YdaU (DUF1376 family)
MASKSDPAFLFYVKDWRSSRKVQAMSFAARGMYLEMLMEQWDAGSVPGSPAECATLLGGTTAEWQRAWPMLKACFKSKRRRGGGNGVPRLVNLKLEEVRRDRLRYKKAQAESGLRGAEARWKKHSKPIGSPSKPIASPMAKNGSDLISSDLISSSTQTPAANGDGLRERFDAFWAVYPKKVGKEDAWRAWRKRRPDRELTAQICAALAWQRQQDNWLLEGGRFVPNPATWINRGQWQDEPSTTPRLSGRTVSTVRAVEEFLK